MTPSLKALLSRIVLGVKLGVHCLFVRTKQCRLSPLFNLNLNFKLTIIVQLVSSHIIPCFVFLLHSLHYPQ
jgi:hypothetical protein